MWLGREKSGECSSVHFYIKSRAVQQGGIIIKLMLHVCFTSVCSESRGKHYDVPFCSTLVYKCKTVCTKKLSALKSIKVQNEWYISSCRYLDRFTCCCTAYIAVCSPSDWQSYMEMSRIFISKRHNRTNNIEIFTVTTIYTYIII